MSINVQIDIAKAMEKQLMDMAKKVQLKTIEALSPIYDFEVQDAVNKIGLELKKTEKKITNKSKTKTRAIPLPWCGEVNTEWCNGLRLDGGLHTQCTNSKIEGGKFCKTCQNQCKNNDDEKPNYGEVSDRVAAGDDYKGAKGKKPIKYSQVMEKKGITREEAVREAAKYGWVIPESEFAKVVKNKNKKKKTTKNVSVSDTESDSDNKQTKKKRGRPSKTKVVKNDDEFNKICDTAFNSNNTSSSESESDTEKKEKKEKKVKKEKKELTEEEKVAKKNETNRKRKETREKNKKAKEEAKKKESELEKQVKAPKQKVMDREGDANNTDDELEEIKVDYLSSDSDVEGVEEHKESMDEESEEDEDRVKIVIGGEEYNMEKGDKDKCLYDKKGICVGTHDEVNNVVVKKGGSDSDSDSDSESDDE